MLRTTISKIRRVCTVAFLPRALRATRKTSGKFEKFSNAAAVYKVQIRSKSDTRGTSGRDEHDRPPPKRIVEFAFASNKPPRKRINRIEDDQTNAMRRKDSASRVQMSRETECEKCERLIAKVFGVDQGKSGRNHLRENASLQDVRLQATRNDEETDPDIDSIDPHKRANIRRPKGTVVTLHTPSKILEKIAQVNLADSKNPELSDNKSIKDAQVHSSEVYDTKEESNKDIEVVTLNATTRKEEQKLGQKVEQIQETPVVEAKEHKIEGFNVTPGALERDAKLNFSEAADKTDLSTENIEGEKLDELASRCVNATDDKIDEQLLKEMDSLKASQPDQPTDNPIHEEDVANMEMVKEERNVSEQSKMDFGEREEKAADFNILQRLYPTFDGLLYERDSKQEDTSPTTFKPERLYSGDKPIYYEEPTVGFEGIEQLKDVYKSSEPLKFDLESTEPLKASFEDCEPLKVGVEGSEPLKADVEDSEPLKADVEDSETQKAGFEGSESIKSYFESTEPLIADNEGSEPLKAGFEGSEPAKADVESSESVKTYFKSTEPLKADVEGSKPLKADVESSEPLKADVEGSETVKAGFEGSEPLKAYFKSTVSLKADVEGSEPLKAGFDVSEPVKAGVEGSEPVKANFESTEPLKDESSVKDVDSDRPKVYPHQVLIDPYDKSTLADEREESDVSDTYHHVPAKEQPIRAIQGMDKEDTEVQNEPRKEVFDPKYVVTCNETCPISAEGLTSAALNAEAGNLKGAEAIYDDLASSNLKKHAFKQVAVENKLENKISDSNEEDIAVESEAKPMIETAEAESVKEISNSPEEELMEEKEETEVEHLHEETKPKEQLSPTSPQLDNTLNPIGKAHLNEEQSVDTLGKDFRATEPVQRNIAANFTMPLPKLNDEQASLSELLKRVRERHRIEYCRAVDIGSNAIEQLGSQAAVVEPELGKCGKKSPPCPPPAPKCPPPDPCKPPPCPPPEPACPKPKPACPPPKNPCPKKKDPCAKFSKLTGYGVPNLISVFFQPKMHPRLTLPVTATNLNGDAIDDTILNAITTKAVLTETIVMKLRNISEVLLCNFELRRLRASRTCNFQKTTQRERIAVKDFEPWTPIPSWPIPRREVRRPFVCPKEGCKMPPPKLNPPCQLNPCINFPKRTFSLAEFLVLFRTKYKLYSHE